jgi:hypothetical protein
MKLIKGSRVGLVLAGILIDNIDKEWSEHL